jgi:hypothetical protein
VTVEEVRARVEEIVHLATVEQDHEGAHLLEDGLRRDFILWLVEEGPYEETYSEQAKLIQSTDDLQFARCFRP